MRKFSNILDDNNVHKAPDGCYQWKIEIVNGCEKWHVYVGCRAKIEGQMLMARDDEQELLSVCAKSL